MAVRASDKVTLAVLASPTYVRLYYVLQASALAAPALPTANPPAAPWTATEPTYTAGSTNTLYTTLLTAYGSLTFGYGAVQVSSSYEAAKAAFNKAVAVESTANGKNTIVRSAAIPTNPPAAIYKASDLWWVFVGTQVTAMYVHDGTNWIAQSLTGATITNLDAGVITAGVITGRTLQTAITGTRVVIDGAANTLKFFGPTSTIAAVITGIDDEGAAPTAITITTALESVRFGHTYLPVSGSVEMHAPSAWVEDLYVSTLTDDTNRLIIGPGGVIDSLTYDSGWKNIVVNTAGGFVANGTPRVRRVGNVLWFMDGFTNAGMTANANHTVGTCPVGYRPLAFYYMTIGSNTGASSGARCVIQTDGAIVIGTTATLGAYYRLDGLTVLALS